MTKHKIPGKSDRVGMTIVDIVRMFPDDATAEAWFTRIRWPNGPACPVCGSVNVQTGTKHKTMPYRCREKECKKRFSVRYGTVMQSTKLSYQQWAIAVYLELTSLKGASSMTLHRDIGITQKSAWHLAHRIRKALESRGKVFDGPVETDETYMGGVRKNMSDAKRADIANTGRGAVGKMAIAGVKERATKRGAAWAAESTDKETLQGFVIEHTARGATVYTDEARAYEGLPYHHETVKHPVSDFVRDQAHTNCKESFWSMLKRAHKGTYHKFSPKHLHRYVNEFAARHHIREEDTIAQMVAVVLGMDGKRPRYGTLIVDNGLDSGARS